MNVGRLLEALKRSRYDLRGKVAVVTGGSRGLGLLIARVLAKRGARVVIAGRDGETLEDAKRWLARHGCNAISVAVDVGEPRGPKKLVDAVLEQYGSIDVLVNNAGTIEVGPYDAMVEEDFKRAIDTHFWGPLRLIDEVVPHMRAIGGGRIVNIVSVGGLVSVPHLLPYSASKFALRGLSLGLHAELAESGIVVSTICPGLLRTGSPRNATFKGDANKEYAWFAVSDALPLLSMSADRAAKRIVRACERGEAHVVLTFPAKVAALANGVFPATTARVLSVVAALLPRGTNTQPKRGKEVDGDAPGLLTRLGDVAAVQNNEVRS